MSAAIQGDFERLRRRGVASDLALAGRSDDQAVVTVEAPERDEPETDPVPAEAAPATREAWLSRLLRRP